MIFMKTKIWSASHGELLIRLNSLDEKLRDILERALNHEIKDLIGFEKELMFEPKKVPSSNQTNCCSIF